MSGETLTSTRWFSLRKRLLLLLLGGVTVGWVVILAFTYVGARHEMDELFDSGIVQTEDSDHAAHIRKELTEQFVKRMLMPGLFGLPLLGLWVWFATRRGLAPIDAVTRQVASRAPDHLEALAPAAAPVEIRPLVEALNTLFGRVGQALDNERRFTADAAHELRTPLAALATQAQVALRARDATERDHAIAQIAAGARRASHLLDQLLTLARLDPAAGLPLCAVRLDQLAAEICADHGLAALEKNLVLELEAPTAVSVPANAGMLRILLRNLIDNAVRYTPAGGQVRVGVGVSAGQVMLSVSDSGPGIPADARTQALQRFHRLAGQETEGSGLGLSIVTRIAELHGAQLELADGMGAPGLTVRLRFPGV